MPDEIYYGIDMALIKCSECGKEMSTAAKACPHCGAKKRQGWTLVRVILVFLFGAIFYKACSTRTDAPVTASSTPAPAPGAVVLTDSGAPGWLYNTADDAMSGSKMAVAALPSIEQLSLEFPYSGRNQPRLTLRSKGKELDVMVSIDKGQILCPLSSCSVSVKFDDDKAVKFTGSGPADHGTTVVFLSPEKRFIDRLKKAKKVLVELNLFHQGTQVLEFRTEGLEWPRK